MKLEGLRTFFAQVKKDLGSTYEDIGIYYFFSQVWHDLSTEKPCEPSHVHALEKARREEIAYHLASSANAWFYFDEGECVVRVRFAQSPQLATRRKVRGRLSETRESSSNAYKVAHNPLTHLLARDEFRVRLASAISEVENEKPAMAAAQESGASRTLAVFALDIDHFKQVNDTWGHLYGDQVLKVFARRLENCAQRIRGNDSSEPQFYLGHPSGEEFLIAVQAKSEKAKIIEWANEFRREIADNLLPLESEWQWLSSVDDISSLVAPSLQERVVTASIGVAIYAGGGGLVAGSEPISNILDKADTALYRAKAAGRNQVISYDEILSSCGRVLEQDEQLNIVAIDLGSNVGVAIGQEFKVFLPTFSGATKFMLNDGRTKRALGYYPRVEATRIVVFNTQPEISFAFIADSESKDTKIVSGSHLEAIPAGSIGHLLPSFSKYFPAASDVQKTPGVSGLQGYVEESAKKGEKPFSVTIRFSRDAEYLRKYGSVSLNMALAQMYREAQVNFHAARYVEIIDRGAVCVVGPKNAYKESLVEDFTNRMASDFPELGVFSGVFCNEDILTKDLDRFSQLGFSHAIEFSRFAAADGGREPDSRVRHFGYPVAMAILQARREAKLFDTAYADFEKLRGLGVESAGLLNFGGLMAGALGLRPQAAEHYLAAVNRDGKDVNAIIYKGNYAIAVYRVGEVEPALKIMNAVSAADLIRLESLNLYAYVTYARLLAKAKVLSLPSFDEHRFREVAPKAISADVHKDSPENLVIRQAMALL